MKKILCVITILLGVAAQLSAKTLYVDNTASGLNDGSSWANAWQSFASIVWGAGAGKVDAGDTLYISGGTVSQTYNETLNISNSGTAGNIILIQTGQDAGHNGQVIIDGGSFTRQYGVRIGNRSYWKLSGKVGTSQNMRITGFYDFGVTFDTTMTNFELEYLEVDHNGNSADRDGINGILQLNSNYASSIHDCHIHDNYQDGIHIVQNNNGVATQFGSFLIYNNLIDNINDDGIELGIGADVYNNEIGPRIFSGGRGHPDGVQFYNSYTKLYNNYIHGMVITTDPGNSNSNIFCDPSSDASATPSNIQIFSNLIVETQPPGVGDVHRGIALSFFETGITGCSNVLCANNTIVGTPFTAIGLTLASLNTSVVSNIVIENNIIVDAGRLSTDAATYERGDGTVTYGSHGASVDVVVDNNNYYASSGTYYTTIEWTSGNILSFPAWQAASGCDSHNSSTLTPNLSGTYFPVATSAAIGTGQDESSFYTTDKAGTAWAGGTGWGMGAYKAAGASGSGGSSFLGSLTLKGSVILH